MSAPVQVLVVGFDQPAFSGEVLAELTRLREAGIVRLVDLLVVSRDADGALETLDIPGGAGLGSVVAALLERRDDGGDSDDSDAGDGAAWSLTDAVPPGSTAAVALIEHLWAEPLRAAIERAGGRPLDETWLAASDLRALETLVARSG